MRLNVRAKLLGVSGLLLLFTVGIGFLAVLNLGSVNGIAHSMYTDKTVPIQQLGLIQGSLIDEQRINLRGIIDAGNADVFTGLDGELAADEQTIATALSTYKATTQSGAEAAALASFNTAYAQYQQLRDQTRQQSRAGDVPSAKATNLKALDQFKAAKGATATLIKLAGDSAKQMSDTVNSTYETSRLLVIVALGLAILIGLAISIWLSRGISNGVQAVQRVLASIADRDAASLERGLGALASNDLTERVEVSTPPHRVVR